MAHFQPQNLKTPRITGRVFRSGEFSQFIDRILFSASPFDRPNIETMVFVEIFVTVTVAAVLAVEAFLLKKICDGEEVSYMNYGPLFHSRGQALALLSATK